MVRATLESLNQRIFISLLGIVFLCAASCSKEDKSDIDPFWVGDTYKGADLGIVFSDFGDTHIIGHSQGEYEINIPPTASGKIIFRLPNWPITKKILHDPDPVERYPVETFISGELGSNKEFAESGTLAFLTIEESLEIPRWGVKIECTGEEYLEFDLMFSPIESLLEDKKMSISSYLLTGNLKNPKISIPNTKWEYFYIHITRNEVQ